MAKHNACIIFIYNIYLVKKTLKYNFFVCLLVCKTIVSMKLSTLCDLYLTGYRLITIINGMKAVLR